MNRLSIILFFSISIVGLMLLAGCGSSRQVNETVGLVWPPPPDEPRIKYVRTFLGEDDFSSGLNDIVKAVGGKSRTMNLQRPFDVCTDNAGRIFISDVVLGVVEIDTVNKEFRPLTENGKVSLKSARGMGYDNGKLFVGLLDLGQVAVVTPEGEFIKAIGKQGTFLSPVDVVCDTVKRRLLIVDNKLHQVLIYSEEGDSLFTIGTRGEDDGEFNMPQAVAVDGNSNIYVVDAFNFRIEIFDSTGKFLKKFGEQGNYFGTFARPKGIALDSYGNIYVLDANHQNYQIFNQEGKLLLFVGKFSPDNDGFQNPVSIAIDRTNTIYVTDQLNQRLQVFKLVNGE